MIVSNRRAPREWREPFRQPIVGPSIVPMGCKAETGRHYTDDHTWRIVADSIDDPNLLPKHIRGAAKTALPKTMTDQHHSIRARLIFFGSEPPAQDGFHGNSLCCPKRVNLSGDPLRFGSSRVVVGYGLPRPRHSSRRFQTRCCVLADPGTCPGLPNPFSLRDLVERTRQPLTVPDRDTA